MRLVLLLRFTSFKLYIIDLNIIIFITTSNIELYRNEIKFIPHKQLLPLKILVPIEFVGNEFCP